MPKETLVEHKNNDSLKPDSMVYFLGLSHKLSKTGNMLDAFCKTTSSGKIINDLLDKCDRNISVYKTNLIKGVPVDGNGKIRYPSEAEKLTGLQRFKKEILVFRPKYVYLFGKQVSDFVLKNFNLEKINDTEYYFGNVRFILAEHPSYIAVYKRNNIEQYQQMILDKIKTLG